jgi:MFS family permease
VHTGLMTLPMAAANVTLSPISGRLVGSVGPRVPLLGAAGCILAAALIMTTFTPTTSLLIVVLAYVLMGLGFGLVNAPITNTAVSGMPRSQAGVAAAVASTSRQVGSSLGVAIFGSILASGGGFTHASSICWWVGVGCAILIGVLGIITTGRAAKASAVRTAAIFTTADADTRVPVGQGT